MWKAERTTEHEYINEGIHLLFNTITDAEEALRQLSLTLMEAQRQAEELFLEAEQEAPAEKGA